MSDFWINLATQRRTIPNEIEGTFNPAANPSLMYAHGWRLASEPDAPAEGYERLGAVTYIQDPNDAERAVAVYTDTLVQDRLDAEAAVQTAAQAAAFAANTERFTYQNAYLMLCDQLRGNQSHERMGFPQIATALAILKGTDAAAYETLRDGFSFLNQALLRIDNRWWDECVWVDNAEIIQAAQGVLTMLAG